jgi:hypothetical protein
MNTDFGRRFSFTLRVSHWFLAVSQSAARQPHALAAQTSAAIHRRPVAAIFDPDEGAGNLKLRRICSAPLRLRVSSGVAPRDSCRNDAASHATETRSRGRLRYKNRVKMR